MRNNDIILEQELKKIGSLIDYDRSKTLMEQDPAWTRNIGRPGWTNPFTGTKVPGNLGDEFKSMSWDHETSGKVELLLVGAGLLLTLTGIGAPVAAALIGAGTVIGVADAAVYFTEGDPYMGTMMLALNLIPGGELASILTKKAGKEIGEQTIKQSRTAMKKFKDEGIEALTDLEK